MTSHESRCRSPRAGFACGHRQFLRYRKLAEYLFLETSSHVPASADCSGGLEVSLQERTWQIPKFGPPHVMGETGKGKALIAQDPSMGLAVADELLESGASSAWATCSEMKGTHVVVSLF